jgi:hypothetical protein
MQDIYRRRWCRLNAIWRVTNYRGQFFFDEKCEMNRFMCATVSTELLLYFCIATGEDFNFYICV